MADRLRSRSASLPGSMHDGFRIRALELVDRSAARFTIEDRHPFQDRRVIELALACPNCQKWRDGVTKFVPRQAVARCLPEAIAARRTKAELSFLFAEALPVGGDAGFCCDIASLRWIDGERLRSMYRDLRQAYAEGRKEFLPHLWPFGWRMASRSGLIPASPASLGPHLTSLEG